MKDITTISTDLNIVDTQVYKAKNVLQTQLGTLEYAPDFGVDIAFFIDEEFQFQNDSFKSYLIQRLAEHHVNVNQVLELLETFVLQFTFIVGEETKSGGFIK
jgi:hypothetical protein